MAVKPIDQQHAYLVAEVQKNRTEIKKLKVYDFSSVDSTITVVGADGAKQGVITPPAGMADINPNLTGKIKIVMPADPANLPQDGYQMSLNGSYLWMDKANGDVMQWQEIKDHVANGDIMVLKRLDNSGGNFKNFELVKWEIAPTKSGKPITVFGNAPEHDKELDIPFNNIMNGAVQIKPEVVGINFNNIPFIKESDSKWTADFHLDDGEYKIELQKAANGKTIIHQWSAGLITNYSITYWKVG